MHGRRVYGSLTGKADLGEMRLLVTESMKFVRGEPPLLTPGARRLTAAIRAD